MAEINPTVSQFTDIRSAKSQADALSSAVTKITSFTLPQLLSTVEDPSLQSLVREAYKDAASGVGSNEGLANLPPQAKATITYVASLVAVDGTIPAQEVKPAAFFSLGVLLASSQLFRVRISYR